MLRLVLKLAFVGFVVGGTANPAIGQDNLVVRGGAQPEMFQERVSYNELDLREAGDRRTLQQRVNAAARRVCYQAFGSVQDYGIGYGRDPGMTCVDLTKKDAQPQVRLAIRQARAGQQMAAGGSVSVVAYGR